MTTFDFRLILFARIFFHKNIFKKMFRQNSSFFSGLIHGDYTKFSKNLPDNLRNTKQLFNYRTVHVEMRHRALRTSIARSHMPQLFTTSRLRLSSNDGQKCDFCKSHSWRGIESGPFLLEWESVTVRGSIPPLAKFSFLPLKLALANRQREISWLLFQLILMISSYNKKDTVHRSTSNLSFSWFFHVQ